MKLLKESRPQQKRTTNIGDHLYLVEGATRWGLYDLKNGTLTIVDQKSGCFLDHLSKIEMTISQKRIFLKEHAVTIWNRVQEIEIEERLFRLDTSVSPNKVSLDFLWLEVTNTCNQKCVHCYMDSGLMQKIFMPIEFAKKIIQQGQQKGVRKLQFVGGEPFVHHGLWEMVKYAHFLNYPEIEIFTNLTLIEEADFEWMKIFGIKIATSLLGHNTDVHDTCTKTPGSFRRWYRNIKRIHNLGIPYRIGVIRMRQNQEVMKDIEKFLRNEGLLKENESFDPDDVRSTGRGQ